MNRLFWGLFLCLLDYDIKVGSMVIGLLPDFLGFFLMMKGLQQLAGENRFFGRGQHMAFGLMIPAVILYAADLLDPGVMARVVLYGVQLVVLVVQLVLIRVIITGLLHLERDRNVQLKGSFLKSIWSILIVICPLCALVYWIPMVGDICYFASAVVSLLFLAAFWDSRKAFYKSV